METVEVVIKLPKEAYERICYQMITSYAIGEAIDAIVNGTVLPKECGELVEWGKVVDMVTEYVQDDDGSVGNTNLKDLLYEVENMERVIEADRGDKNG